MPPSENAQEIEELQQKLSALTEEKMRLNNEATEWAEKRNRLNEQITSLRREINGLRDGRDSLNEEVKELKELREETRKTTQEKIVEIRETRQQIEALAEKTPSQSLQTLQKKIGDIDWKIQTTPLELQEEKKLVESVGLLEAQVNIHKNLEALKTKMLELRTQLRAAKTENKIHHQRLIETAQKSQEIHKEMLNRINEAKELSVEADSMHENFVKTRQEIKPVAEEITRILDQLKLRKEEIRKEEEEEKKKREEALRKKIEERVKEKLRRGEKLTWQEFQILAEEEETTQD